MEVINKVRGERAKEISDTIATMLTERPLLGHNIHPLIFSVRYVKPAKSGVLTPLYMYGILENPAVFYNSTNENDDVIYLSSVRNEHFSKIGDEKWALKKSDFEISIFLKAVDVEKIMKNCSPEDIINAKSPEDESIINLYVGHVAYKYIGKMSEKKIQPLSKDTYRI